MRQELLSCLKFDRSYFDNAFMLRFYLTLVLDANEEDKKWHGIIIKRSICYFFVSSFDAVQYDNAADKNSIEKTKRKRDNCKLNHKIYYDNHSGL